jgi:hypothetical protein
MSENTSHQAYKKCSKRHRGSWTALFLVIGIVSGCGSIEAQHQKEEAMKVSQTTMDRETILVAGGDLSYPKRVLGKLDYTEPVSPEAIEASSVNERLRKIAIARYGDEVDAITNVHIDVNEAATEVKVAADAVRITSPCSFCRHKSSDVDASQAGAGH